MMKKYIFCFGLLLFFLAACDQSKPEVVATNTAQPEVMPTFTPTAVATNTPIPSATPNPLYQGTAVYPWWNDTVFYEVFVRSFYDSDGDGIGDINGLIEKLDHLNDGDPTTTDDLGVTGLWLMPIMASPSYHGYDVTDYYQIDPEYGTKEDFQRLMEEAHKRGMRVVVDMVLNHTSVEHPWFEESSDPTSEKRDWYVWADEDPGYRGPGNEKVWHQTPDGYYYALFWDGMPDLNYENTAVTEAMQEATRFWLEEMGVDGFRLDAIKFIIEEGEAQQNTPSTHQWLQEQHTFYKEINPDALIVGEAWANTQQVLTYTGDEVDIAFQFDLAQDILNSSNVGLGSVVAKTQNEIVASYPPHQYATFITNHDQNRVMSQLDGDEGKAKVAASILLTGPGVPFVYYGEEIGMTGSKPDEDIRRPMQWSGESYRTGFTTGSPWRGPANDFAERSVALQTDDSDSLLSHYRDLVHLRNTHEALRVGEWTLVDAKPGRLYAYLRHIDDEIILVIINTSANETTNYGLNLEAGPLPDGVEASLLFGEGDLTSPTVTETGGFAGYVPLATLPGHSTSLILLSP